MRDWLAEAFMKNGNNHIEVTPTLETPLVEKIRELTAAAVKRYQEIEEERRQLLEAFPHLKTIVSPPKARETKSAPEVMYVAPAKPRGRHKPLDREGVAEALRAGATHKEVSEKFGISGSTVWKLSKEIGVSRPKGRRPKVVGKTGRAAEKEAQPFKGASKTSVQALAIVKEQGKMLVKDLAKLMKKDGPTVHSALRNLQKHGYVKTSRVKEGGLTNVIVEVVQ